MAITGAAAAASVNSEPHFDAVEYDDFLTAHGTPSVWRRGVQCPCVDETTGHAQVGCPFCETGFGIVWDDGTDIIVLAPGRQRGDDYDVTGMWMSGMVVLTFPSTVTPCHLDIVELMAAVMVVSRETLARGDKNKLGQSKERLRFRKVIDVEKVIAIYDDALHTFVPGTDFNLQADASIVWVDELHGPPAGIQYSVRYRAHPSYVIISPQSRDENGTKLPYKMLAQRLDFFHRAAVGEATPL